MEVEIINKTIYRITTIELIINPETGEQESITIVKDLSAEDVELMKNNIRQREITIRELSEQNKKEAEILEAIALRRQ